jgi:hypothetical protein
LGHYSFLCESFAFFAVKYGGKNQTAKNAKTSAKKIAGSATAPVETPGKQLFVVEVSAIDVPLKAHLGSSGIQWKRPDIWRKMQPGIWAEI